MRITVIERRAITVEVNTDDFAIAKEISEQVYKDNCKDDSVMTVLGHEFVSGENDSVDFLMDSDGNSIEF